MPTGKPIIYWDSCIFLSWIKDENRPNNEMDGVNDVAEKIFKDHAILLTSDITIGEILDSTLDDVAKQKLKDIFKRRNCRSVAADRRVNNLASEIRDYYQQQKQTYALPTLTLPDAIHLATAIIYSANEFHTFDGKDERNRRRALLPLNGDVAGKYPLVICKPPLPPQLPLFKVPPSVKQEDGITSKEVILRNDNIINEENQVDTQSSDGGQEVHEKTEEPRDAEESRSE